MPAIGFLVAWFGYGLASWGYFMVKGYDVPLSSWLNPVHPFTGKPSDAGTIPAGQIFPGSASSPAPAKKPGTATGGGVPPGKNGKCQPGFQLGADGQCHRIPIPPTGR